MKEKDSSYPTTFFSKTSSNSLHRIEKRENIREGLILLWFFFSNKKKLLSDFLNPLSIMNVVYSVITNLVLFSSDTKKNKKRKKYWKIKKTVVSKINPTLYPSLFYFVFGLWHKYYSRINPTGISHFQFFVLLKFILSFQLKVKE